MHQAKKLSLVIIACLTLLAPAFAGAVFEGIQPVVFSVSPSTVSQGGDVLCTITCDSVAASDTDIAITASDSSLFSSLPTVVTLEAGHNSVSFYATVSGSAFGFFTLSGSANGTTATSAPELIHT